MNASVPQHLHSLKAPNFLAKIVDVRRSDPRPVPNAGLSCVQLDPCTCFQSGAHDIVQRSRSLWGRQDVRVIQKREQNVHLGSCCSCLPSARCGHPDRIPLFATFFLPDVVADPSSSNHTYVAVSPYANLANGKGPWSARTSNNLTSIALRFT